MKFSASRSALLSHCRYAFREDVAHKDWPQTPESQLGTCLHEMAETFTKYPREHGDLTSADYAHIVGKYAIEDYDKLARYWIHMRDWLVRFTWNADNRAIAELKLAVDLEARTARELTEPGQRNYSGKLPHEIPMSIDLVMFGQEKRPVLLDWKTGHSGDGYWPQLATNALALSWWLRDKHALVWTQWRSVEAVVLHVTETGVNDTRRRPFDRVELASIADDLALWLSEVPDATPQPGEHCTLLRCTAFEGCPAVKREIVTVENLIREVDKVEPGELSLTITNADQAWKALQTIRIYDSMADRVRKVVGDYVGDMDHILSDGSMLRRTYRNMMRMNVAALEELAKTLGATDEQIAVCVRSQKENAGIRAVKPKKEKKNGRRLVQAGGEGADEPEERDDDSRGTPGAA